MGMDGLIWVPYRLSIYIHVDRLVNLNCAHFAVHTVAYKLGFPSVVVLSTNEILLKAHY